MSAIIPAILPTSREDLEHKLAALQGLVTEVQIDIVDGRFASPASWPYGEGSKEFASAVAEGDPLPYLGHMQFEMDLMVSDPEIMTGAWIASGANRITIHAESTNYLPKVMTDLQVKYGHSKDFAPDLLSVGIALNIATDNAFIEPYLDRADYVQFMGIRNIGKQGEPFDPSVLRKIAAFRRKYPDTPMQVDGGVSLETAPALLTAGVDRLIIGSKIWKSQNLAEELGRFHELAQEYGIYA